MSVLPKALLVGSTDIDARLDLMRYLSSSFDVCALGSSTTLHAKFSAAGFDYTSYTLSRKANPLMDLLTLGQLFFMFRKLKPQLVHAFDTKPCVWARIAARLAGVPVVIGTLPGLGSLYVNNDFLSRLLRSIYQRLQQMACYFSDLTIFQNHDDARQFINDGIISPQKVMVIPGSGVSTDLFDQSKVPEVIRTELRRELDIQSDQIVVTMVSRLIKSKGVFEFMIAAQKIREHFPNVYFLLVGPEDDESIDRLNADELEQLKGTVSWLGARRDISAILAVSDIFVLPSAYREGIPRVLLEAASMGLPIVTTDSPGCREVVENNINGFLVPIRDSFALCQALIRLVEEPNLRLRFGQMSRKRSVENFDFLTIAKQIHIVYEQLLNRQSISTIK